VIPGTAWQVEANEYWRLQSGGYRASSTFLCYKPNCVLYRDLEATAYVRLGSISPHSKGAGRFIISSGGPGQSSDPASRNCCNYSLGWDVKTGQSYAEEVHTLPFFQCRSVVGPLANRTLGIKMVLYHSSRGDVVLEGWVDQHNNNQWTLFYGDENPKGV
jgi:hypothetical protein